MESLPKSYKAVACPGANQGWRYLMRPLRPPNPAEILIRVHASGICNSDHFVQEKKWPGIMYPRVPGHEVVGRIAAVGEAVRQQQKIDGTSGASKEEVREGGRFEIGSLVGVGWNGGYCGRCRYCRKGDFPGCLELQITGINHDGGHAEYIYAPANSVVHFPPSALAGASYAQLTSLLCAGTTVYHALRTTPNYVPGDLCLVHGIGGLGHLAIQYASKLGLRVLAVSASPAQASKRDVALALGAHEYLDASVPAPSSPASPPDSETTHSEVDAEAARLAEIVAAVQAMGGAQVILATTPSAASVNAIIPAVARNGCVTVVATTDGHVGMNNVALNVRRATIRGWACGAAGETEDCVRFSCAAGIKAIVKEWNFEDYADAYRDTMEGRPEFRNVLVFP